MPLNADWSYTQEQCWYFLRGAASVSLRHGVVQVPTSQSFRPNLRLWSSSKYLIHAFWCILMHFREIPMAHHGRQIDRGAAGCCSKGLACPYAHHEPYQEANYQQAQSEITEMTGDSGMWSFFTVCYWNGPFSSMIYQLYTSNYNN